MPKSLILLCTLAAAAFAGPADPGRETASPAPVRFYFGLPGSGEYVTGRVPPTTESPGWTLHGRFPASLMDNAAAATETHVYALPGYSTASNPLTFARLANGAVTWETLPPPPFQISNGGAAIIGDTLYYATGVSYGMTPPRTLDTLLKYSIANRSWTVAPGPHGTGLKYNWQPLVLAAAGRVFYISGAREPGADWPTRQVWAYTPGAGWARVADMNQGRVFAAGWVYNDTIWVAGGAHGDDGVLDHTEFYCPTANAWTVNNTVFPRLPFRVWGMGSGIVGNTAFIAAGVDQLGGLSDRVAQFDHQTRTWTETGTVLLPVYRTAGIGTPDGKALIICGSTGGFAPTDTVQYEQVGPGPATDVGVSAVVAPVGAIPTGNVTPRVRIRNYGAEPQSNIPAQIVIDFAGTTVYSASLNYPGPLAPGASAEAEFSPDWDATEGEFTITSWTALPGDENPRNDTTRAAVMVSALAWETIPQPPSAQDRIVHVTVYDPGTDRIYMLGGNPEGYRNTYDGLNRYFDPASATWTDQAPMPVPLGWCGYGVVDHRIYIIGGHDNRTNPVADNQEFDIATNTWTARTGRPGRPAFAPLSATWRNRLIYVMGGVEEFRYTNRVDIYNPAINAWAVGTSLPRNGFMGSAAIIGDTIYIPQAYDGGACWPNLYKGAIDPSNPTRITWLPGPALPERAFNGSTVVIGGELYWLGGFVAGEGAVNRIWKYSPATGAITRFAPDYPDRVARITFAAVRETPGVTEIYGMAGDKDGDWDLPNRTYVKLSLPYVGVEEAPGAERIARNPGPTIIRGSLFLQPGSCPDHPRSALCLCGSKSAPVLLDISGRKVMELAPGENDVRRLAPGVYFIRAEGAGNQALSRRVIIQR